MRVRSALLFATVIAVLAAGSSGQAQSENTLDDAALDFFEKKVRPLLAERCHECHSAKLDEPKGGLRLDSRAALLKGGDTGPAAVAGNAKESLLVDAINYGDLYQMPPKSKLPADEIAVLTRWVEMGAPWPQEAGPTDAAAGKEFNLQQRKASHWAWRPVRDVPPPNVGDASWPRDDIDRFILAALEEKGLAPAAPADRRSLIRRASFDLTGLPPTPQEVEAFVADESPHAFRKVVDRLLDSPHFGERWARHWMDLVRFAESYGHEFDFDIPHAWRYRDYLIRAFNADVPYDQLVIEHIAGDLVANPRLHPTEKFNESVIGGGFWFLGEATHAPVDVRGDEAIRVDNQLDVMSKTFLAMTVACARCHDHKFDAISTKDYYALAGFLQSSSRQQAPLDPHGRIAAAAARLSQLQSRGDQTLQSAAGENSPGAAERFAGYLLAARELAAGGELPPAQAAEKYNLDAPRLQAWLDALRDDAANDVSHPLYLWRALADKGIDISSKDISAERGRLLVAQETWNKFDAQSPALADFEGTGFGNWRASGAAFGAAPTQPGKWRRRAEGFGLQTPGLAHSGALSLKLQGVLRSPTFTITHKNLLYRVAGRDCQVRLIVDGYFMDEFSALLFQGFKFKVNSGDEFTWHRQANDVERYVGHRAHIEIIDHGDGYAAVDEIRFSDGAAPPPKVNPLTRKLVRDERIESLKSLAAAFGREMAGALSALRDGEPTAEQAKLADYAIAHNLVDMPPASQNKLAGVAAQMEDVESSLPAPVRVISIADGSSENERVFVRGNHRTPGDEAPRRLLQALAGEEPLQPPRGSGRLELARQIVDPANPLTARVMVNRTWHHLFGRGIVASVDNFGVLGQRPTHPALLDHLAVRFMREGWSVKRLIRALMLSSTYRMSSAPNPRAAEIDPQNLVLHRMRIRRLQGEAIRDAVLFVSGRLEPGLFGPATPVHLTEFMQGRGRPKASGPLDGDGRRSIYINVRRNFLPPMMLAFDTPAPFSTVGRRNSSNVPAQALILMNDPFVVEQSKVWARRLLEDQNATPDERVARMYLQAFSRPPTDEEAAAAVAFLHQQGQQHGLAPGENPADARVWADLCHVIMNVKEFIFIR